MKTLLAAAALILAASSASALTFENDYVYYQPCSCYVLVASTTVSSSGEVLNYKVYVDFGNPDPAELDAAIAKALAEGDTEALEEAIEDAIAAGDVSLAEQLQSRYDELRGQLEAYYDRYDLDTGLIDTDVQAIINAELSGNQAVAQALTYNFITEYIVNTDLNTWQQADYIATEVIVAEMTELQREGAQP